jgi:hypothetical protein
VPYFQQILYCVETCWFSENLAAVLTVHSQQKVSKTEIKPMH